MKRDSDKAKLPDKAGIEESLTPALERITGAVALTFRRFPQFFWLLFSIIILLILSPLLVSTWDLSGGNVWSETVKNVIEALAIVAGAFALVQWVTERRDRATDILFQLADRFDAVERGKQMIDDDDEYRKKTAPSLKQSVMTRTFDDNVDVIDEFLDFYILLHGVRHARQVPDAPLSVCFRYWLAYYFHRERKEFRDYVNTFYPTLARWLHEDCKQGLPFFRPHRLFGNKTDDEAIEKCHQNPLV